MMDFANAPDMYPSQSCRIRMYSNFLFWNDLLTKKIFLILCFFVVQAQLKFPHDYPYNPPTVRFLSKVWHPNVYEVST
jgi:hypothetical protein